MPQKGRQGVLQAPGRAEAQGPAQQQAQVEAGHVDQQPFEDVGVAAKVRATHPSGVITMSEAPFDELPALPHQPFAPRPARDWAASANFE